MEFDRESVNLVKWKTVNRIDLSQEEREMAFWYVNSSALLIWQGIQFLFGFNKHPISQAKNNSIQPNNSIVRTPLPRSFPHNLPRTFT